MKPALYHYFELLSLIVSIICLSRIRSLYFIWFIPFLAITLFTELFANYTYYIKHLHTGWMYNLLNPVTQTFYTYIFYKLAKSKTYRVFLVTCNSIYIAFYIIYYMIFSNINDFNNYLIAVGAVQQVIFACAFFYECLQNDQVIDDQVRSGLWIAAGLLIFYSGVALCLTLFDFIKKNNLEIAGLPLYNFIPRFLSLILYSCLSVSFILWKRSMTRKL